MGFKLRRIRSPRSVPGVKIPGKSMKRLEFPEDDPELGEDSICGEIDRVSIYRQVQQDRRRGPV